MSIGIRERWNTFGNACRSSVGRGLVAGLIAREHRDRRVGVLIEGQREERHLERRIRQAHRGAREGRERRAPTFTPAATSGGVARSTTNSEPPRLRKWCVETTPTRGGSSRTVISFVTVDSASRQPKSTGRAAVMVSVAGPATEFGLRGLAERPDHPQAIGTGLLDVAGGPAASSSEKTCIALPPCVSAAVSRVSLPAGRIHEELERALLADEGARALDLDGRSGLASGHEPRGRAAADGNDHDRHEGASDELHLQILVARRRASPGRARRLAGPPGRSPG